MKSLQQRLVLLLLLPVALVLSSAGIFGFIYANRIMLNEWQEAAIVKLQRAAHHLDMQLSRPIEWVEMFHKTAGEGSDYIFQDWILRQLRELKGVSRVDLQWLDKRPDPNMMRRGEHQMGMTGMMPFRHGRIADVSPPMYDANAGHETMSLISTLKDESGQIVGKLEVVISFDYLMQDIRSAGWWQSDLACLVDESGGYLAHSKEFKGLSRLGETNDPLELAILAAMKEKGFGTLQGPGYPPERVAGFYKIEHAPWTIILFAPGKMILAPIVRFQFYYAAAGIICIVFILLLIRTVGGRMVHSVRVISQAAKQVARGIYGDPLEQKSNDEIGQLIESFNAMVEGLKERDFISNTFGRYVDAEIAAELMRRPEAARLGGKKREVVILISDIRGFTRLSEALSPEGTIMILNRYFHHMIEVIKKHRGIIVDFYGDGVLAFFDPLDEPIGPIIHRGIQCALEMQNAMKGLNAKIRTVGLPQLEIGIGLNAGQVVVGNIGSETRAKYGIVGSAVNLTQRIQEMAHGQEVVISDSIYQHAKESLVIKKSFEVQLRGFQEPVKLHVVEDFQGIS